MDSATRDVADVFIEDLDIFCDPYVIISQISFGEGTDSGLLFELIESIVLVWEDLFLNAFEVEHLKEFAKFACQNKESVFEVDYLTVVLDVSFHLLSSIDNGLSDTFLEFDFS